MKGVVGAYLRDAPQNKNANRSRCVSPRRTPQARMQIVVGADRRDAPSQARDFIVRNYGIKEFSAEQQLPSL